MAALGPKRAASLPDLPTIGEQGVKGFTLTNRYNWWVPAGTPRPIIAALNKVIPDGMHSPQMAQTARGRRQRAGRAHDARGAQGSLAREYVEVERTVKALDLKLK